MLKTFYHRFIQRLNRSRVQSMPSSKAAAPNAAIRYMLKVIPAGYRRMILLSSLIAYITNTDNPERDFVRNMDQALQLSRGGANSLEFPIRLYRVFWGDRELFKNEIEVLINPQKTRCEKQSAASSIAQKVPDWFIYASPAKLVDDLLQYFAREPEKALQAA